MFWKKDTVSFYCVIIRHRTNIHNDSCRVSLIRSITCCNDIFNISNRFRENEEERYVLEKNIRFHFTV